MRTAAIALLVVMMAAPVMANDALQERLIAQKYGECAVAKDAAAAKTVVTDDLPGRDIVTKYKKLVSPDCLPKYAGRGMSMRLDDMTMKAALAQALVRRDFAAINAPNLSALPPLSHQQPYPVETVDKRTGKPLSKKAIAAQEAAVARKTLDYKVALMGECIVRKDATGAKAVLMSPIGDASEMAALKAIAPVVGSCIRKGEEVRFDRMTLRNTIAINYYRLTSKALAIGGAEDA